MPEIKNYDVIIAGAGMAGLTAAAYLAKEGYRTLVLEKAMKPGGLVNSFEHQGFVFDAGIRAIENTGIVFPMIRQLGIDMELVKSPVSIGIGRHMVALDSRQSLADYQSLLNNIFPESHEEIQQITDRIREVMSYMDVLYGIENPLFKDIKDDFRYLSKTLLPWLARYQMNISKIEKLNLPVVQYLKKFTHNQALIDMITQHFFHNTPTFFALSYFGLYLDYQYPIGGTGVFPQKMAEKIQEWGGEIRTETEILRVDAKNRIIGTADGMSCRYKKLVWAANSKTLYSLLAEDALVVRKDARSWQAQKDKVMSHHGNDSVLSFFLGLDKAPAIYADICGPHCFYTPSIHGLSTLKPESWLDVEKAETLTDQQKIQGLMEWTRDFLDLTTYEISIPASRDPQLAPQGKTGIIASTLFPYDMVRTVGLHGLLDQWKDEVGKHLIHVLSDVLFPGFSDDVEFVLISTPLTIERFSGNTDGAITGWAFTPDDMPAETRLKKIKNAIMTPIEDVYQAGQWTFSPSGLPISILTGKLAADAVARDLKKAAKIDILEDGDGF